MWKPHMSHDCNDTLLAQYSMAQTSSNTKSVADPPPPPTSLPGPPCLPSNTSFHSKKWFAVCAHEKCNFHFCGLVVGIFNFLCLKISEKSHFWILVFKRKLLWFCDANIYVEPIQYIMILWCEHLRRTQSIHYDFVLRTSTSNIINTFMILLCPRQRRN